MSCLWNCDNGDAKMVEILMVRRLFVVFNVMVFIFDVHVDELLNASSGGDRIIIVSEC